MPTLRGSLLKMISTLEDPVRYELPVGAERLPLNPRLGTTFKITYTGEIRCIHCGRKISKSFSQGHCYPCCQKLARCDLCIVRPELCHYHMGTCREPEWGEKHCLITHTVYLANSSGLKVGITRSHQQVTRWIDQGAHQALPIRTVGGRLESGLAEVALKRYVPDKTDWRRMLRGEPAPLDLSAARDDLLRKCSEEHADEVLPGETVPDAQVTEIRYPVLEYPEKVTSLNLDKNPEVEGTLQGIKGQYLILDTGVINIRKYQGYVCDVDH